MELAEFFEFMYGEEKGYVYVALKNPNSGAFLQHYYEWPAEADKLIERVQMSYKKYEVYYAPSLFRVASAQKTDVLGSNVVWVEFDGTVPNLSKFPNIPEPSLRIRSSDESHEHWYWRLDSICDPERVERINRGLTYLLGADVSGWDASQILRPPGTRNHKRDKAVETLSVTSVRISLSEFGEIPDPPPVGKTFEPTDIPDVLDVIAKSKWRKSVWELFREGVPEGSRSSGLMSLGYSLAEAGLSEPEMLSVLVNADQRWGKFANRSDQIQRLSEIVTKAKAKFPGKKVDTETTLILPRFTFQALLDSDIQLEWVWENYLQEQGYFLLSGPPGVGKTQFSLGFAMAAAIGRSFLNQKVVSPRKIGFYSLEMPAPDLKHFVNILSTNLTKEERTLLEANLVFFPYGEPLYLTDETVQKMIQEQVGDEKFDGVILDSMMAATDRSVSDDETAKKLVDWDAHLRATGVFTWWITHQRKEQVGNKKPVHLGDVYGSVHITRQATTCFCLWQEQEAEDKSLLEVVPMKVRLSTTPAPFMVRRGEDLIVECVKEKGLGGLSIVQSGASSGSAKPVFSGSKPIKF